MSKRRHVDRPLSEKLKILNLLSSGMKQKDLCEKYQLSQSTLSTWKKQQSKLNELADSGKATLKVKRMRESFLPKVDRAMHLWFCEMRSKPNPPSISQHMLIQKATL